MALDQLWAVLACVLLVSLAVFQGALIAGAPIGHLAWGGQHRILPAKLRIGSAVSIPLYALFAYTALARADLAPALVSGGFTEVAIWVLAGYFTLGVLMNAISRSKAERFVMTPAALALAGLYLMLAMAETNL